MPTYGGWNFVQEKQVVTDLESKGVLDLFRFDVNIGYRQPFVGMTKTIKFEVSSSNCRGCYTDQVNSSTFIIFGWCISRRKDSANDKCVAGCR